MPAVAVDAWRNGASHRAIQSASRDEVFRATIGFASPP